MHAPNVVMRSNQGRVCNEMFTASLIRLESVGKTAESGNWHVALLAMQ
jgi:hypothetical protein